MDFTANGQKVQAIGALTINGTVKATGNTVGYTLSGDTIKGSGSVATSGGAVTLIGTSGITVGDILVGETAALGTGAVVLTSTNGNISASSIKTSGAVTVSANATGDINLGAVSGAATTIYAKEGDVTLSTIDAYGAVSVSDISGDIELNGNISVTGDNKQVVVSATAGKITGASAGITTGGGAVSLIASSGVSIGDVLIGSANALGSGAVVLTSTNGNISASSIKTSGAVTVSATTSGNITLSSDIETVGTIIIGTASGDVKTSGTLTGSAVSITAQGAGSISLGGNVTADDALTLTASGDVDASSVTLTPGAGSTFTAGGALQLGTVKASGLAMTLVNGAGETDLNSLEATTLNISSTDESASYTITTLGDGSSVTGVTTASSTTLNVTGTLAGSGSAAFVNLKSGAILDASTASVSLSGTGLVNASGASTVILDGASLLTIESDSSSATTASGIALSSNLTQGAISLGKAEDTLTLKNATGTIYYNEASGLASALEVVKEAVLGSGAAGTVSLAGVSYQTLDGGTPTVEEALSADANFVGTVNELATESADANASGTVSVSVTGEPEFAAIDLVKSSATGAAEATTLSLTGNGTLTLSDATADDVSGNNTAFVTGSDGNATDVVLNGTTELALNGAGEIGTVTGATGTLTINEGTAATDSTASAITTEGLGKATANASGTSVTLTPLGKVDVINGSLTVSSGEAESVVADVELGGSDALGAIHSGTLNLEGDAVITDVVNAHTAASTLNATGNLQLGDDNSGAGTAVTLTGATVNADTLDFAKAALITVTDNQTDAYDADGNKLDSLGSTVTAGAAKFNGATLFVDPSVVIINSLISSDEDKNVNVTTETATSVLSGNIDLGKQSAIYLATNGKAFADNTTFKALLTQSTTNASGYALTTEDSDGNDINGGNYTVLWTEGDLIIDTKYGITVDGDNTTYAATDVTTNQVKITDGGVLAVSGALSFYGSVTNSADAAYHQGTGSVFTLAPTDVVTAQATYSDATYATKTANSVLGGGTLAFTADGASVTAEQVLLSNGEVDVATGTATVKLTGTATTSTTVGRNTLFTAQVDNFDIEDGATLVLDNTAQATTSTATADINYSLVSTTNGQVTWNGTAAVNPTDGTQINGTLQLTGTWQIAAGTELKNFATQSVRLSDGNTYTLKDGTLVVSEGSFLKVIASTTQGAGVSGFGEIVNNGTITLAGDTANSTWAWLGERLADYYLDITNNGVISLQGNTALGANANNSITNNGTVTVTGTGNWSVASDGIDNVYVGTWAQSSDGILNVGSGTTAGVLTMNADIYDLDGAINVANANSTLTIINQSHNDTTNATVADLSSVDFSNAGTVILEGSFKVSGNQLDSTAGAASSGSLLWGDTTGSHGILTLSNGARVFADSADLSEVSSTNQLLTANNWGYLTISGTTKAGSELTVANIGINTATLSTDEDVLEISTGKVEVTTALRADTIYVKNGWGDTLTLGHDGGEFDAGKVTLIATGNTTGTTDIKFDGTSSNVGTLQAGVKAGDTNLNNAAALTGEIEVDYDITASALNVATAGSIIKFTDDSESTISGTLSAVQQTTQATSPVGVVIEEGAVLTAQKGLEVEANSIALNNGTLVLTRKDILGAAVPETSTTSALAEALAEGASAGFVYSNSVLDEVAIDGFSGTTLTAAQYSVLQNSIVYSNTGKGIVTTEATYNTAALDGVSNGKIAYADIPNTVLNGEFLKDVAVTDIASSNVITGSKTWGSAQLKSGSTTLNIGTGTTDGKLELTDAVQVAATETTAASELYVAQSDGTTAANVVLGGANADGYLFLNGAGSLGNVTFGSVDSGLDIDGGDGDTRAAATIAQLKNTSGTDNAGLVNLDNVDLTVTTGAINLSDVSLDNSSVTGASSVNIANLGGSVTSEITAARSLTVQNVSESISGSTFTANDGNLNVSINNGTGTLSVYSTTFKASEKVDVTTAQFNPVSGNTLTAGTNATLTGGADAAITWNNVTAGEGGTATLATGAINLGTDGNVYSKDLSHNTVTATGEDSVAVFNAGDGFQDAATKKVEGSHNLSENVVTAETVKYNAGAYNTVDHDTVTASESFDVDLGDKTTVKNSTFTANGISTADEEVKSTIHGELTANNTVTATNSTLKLDDDLYVLGESTVTAGLLDLADNRLFIDPSYVWTQGVVNGTADDTIDGELIVGAGSAIYIGAEDAADNDIANVSALKSYLASSGYNSVAYIETPVTLTTGSYLAVNNALTSDTVDSYIGTANSVTVASGDALVVTADALGEQDADGNYTEAAITFKTTGTVDIDGTLEIKGINSFSGEAITVFDKVSSVDAAKVLAGNHLFTGTLALSGNDGVVTLKYDEDTANEWLEKTDDSIADPIKAYAASSNADQQFRANSFVNKALNLGSAEEVGKSLNSAARIAVLGGATQNVQLASRSATDALEERQGLIAKTSSSVGQVQGQDVTVWVTPLYAKQDSDGYDGGKSGDLGVDGKLWGVTLGVDGALDNGLTIGAAFHVGSGDSDSNGSGYASTDGDFDFWGLSFYGAYSFDGFKVLGDITYTVADNDIDQNNAAGHLDTSMDSKLLTVGLQGKYDFDIDGITITPHIGLRYHKLDVESYTVNFQGGERFDGKSFDASYVTIPVGIGISKDILTSGGWTVKPAADFSIIPVAGDKDVTTKIVSNDITMAADSDITDDVLFRLRLGVDAQYRNFGLGFGYGYLGGSDTKSHNLSATLRYTF